MNRLFTASVAKSASSSFAFSATSLTRSCAFTSSASLVSSQSPVQTASITCESRCRFFHASLSSHAAAGGEAELDNDDAVFSSKLVKKGKSGAKGAFAKSITFDITRAASMSLDDLYDTFHRRGKFMNALHINRFLYRYMRLAEKSDEQRDGGASVMTGTTKAAMMRDRRLGWIIQRTVELVRFMDARTLANTTQIIAKLGPSMQAQSQLLLKVICRYALIHIDDFRPAEVANLAQSLSSIAIITKEDSLSKLDDRVGTCTTESVYVCVCVPSRICVYVHMYIRVHVC